MSARYSIAALALAVAAAGTVYQLKYWVREREGSLWRLRGAVQEEVWRIRTLEADLAFLTRPERLALQAPQLGMVPVTPKALARLEDIPRVDEIPVAGIGGVTPVNAVPVPRPARR
ncbi:hypothetical protein SH611_19815 [Geminicoccaceae bacterium 1502E]|nr:hypothetical protein [Geminicoccaceae bacterium 1502E]